MKFERLRPGLRDFSIPAAWRLARRFGGLAAGVVFAGSQGVAQSVPRLIRDIHTLPTLEDPGPQAIRESAGAVYFELAEFREDQYWPAVPWQSDGTPAGTRKVGMPVEGFASWDPRTFVRSGDDWYFGAFRSGSGNRLWKTDGTAAGTPEAVGQAFPDSPANLIDLDGVLLFTVKHGRVHVPWRSDGTPAGTYPLSGADVTADPVPGGFASIRSFTRSGDSVYFVANGSELWRSQGTRETTTRVKQFVLGHGESLGPMVSCRGKVWLVLRRVAQAGDLWCSAGTAETTVKIGGQPGEAAWSWPRELGVNGDVL